MPLEVTGDGPTISLGLVMGIALGETPSSIPSDDLGRSSDDSAELRADLLQLVSYSDEKLKPLGTDNDWNRGELFVAGEFGDMEKSV